MSSVTSVPLVAMHIRRPFSVPYCAISKRSGRRSGSPPERTRTGLQKEVMSSISFLASSVVKSVSWETMEEEARQWMQFRLQRPVTSQAIHFGMNSSLATQVPLSGSAPTPKTVLPRTRQPSYYNRWRALFRHFGVLPGVLTVADRLVGLRQHARRLLGREQVHAPGQFRNRLAVFVFLVVKRTEQQVRLQKPVAQAQRRPPAPF